MDETKVVQKGFSKYQEEELKLGREHNIDVSYYDNPEFLSVQMRQIRLGLEDGLTVDLYADPRFDWFQMEEIRKGLLRHVDVKIYAKPDIPHNKMRQIRKGLEQKVNLISYVNLDAGIIRQLRKSRKSKVNLVKYINEGYDEEQLNQIRLALENGVEIDPFLSPEYRGISIMEIRLGLEKGLDISPYAKLEYDWRQMREIRLGMESRIMFVKYSDPLFSWGQMHEIRLGLEDGLEVDSYCSLMYPSKVMKKKRLRLLTEEELITKTKKEEVFEEDYQLTITDGAMEAYMIPNFGDKVMSANEVKQILKEKGVVKGYIEENVSAVADGQCNGKKVLVAKGDIPHVGRDGWYEYFFRTNVEKRPRILENGDVDYANVEWFETVKEGQKLAFYHEAEIGEAGYTVTGKRTKGKKGRELPLLNGKGFILEDDKKTYIAASDGMITIFDFQLLISKRLVLDEVTMATGNLSFDGSIEIRGKVGNGTKIVATDDIIIDGFVGSSRIECGGKVIMKAGMNAAGNGYVKAGKSVVSRFFESVEVYCKGDIQTNYCLNSILHAEGMVTIIESLVGGTIYAERGVKAYNVGNKMNIKTNLILGMNQNLTKEKKTLDAAVRETEAELTSLKQNYTEIKEKYPPEVRNTMEVYIKLEDSVLTVAKQLEELYEKRRNVEASLMKVNDAKLTVTGAAYEGVVVEIGGNTWRAANQYNVIVRRVGGNMEVYTNT